MTGVIAIGPVAASAFYWSQDACKKSGNECANITFY